VWAQVAIAHAHEVWVDPTQYQLPPGGKVIADVKNGEGFAGISLRYNPDDIVRAQIVIDEASQAITGRLGDKPAIAIDPPASQGLAVLAYRSSVDWLTYASMEKFENFVTHKDAAWTLDAHTARGLPEEGFREAYIRNAKSLVALGHGRGDDRIIGLETEFVARENPYGPDTDDGLDVALYLFDEPWADQQVEVFEKDDEGAVTISLLRTDADGMVTVPVTPGNTYLLDAVHLREPSPELAQETGAVWESLWASLTFSVPDDAVTQ